MAEKNRETYVEVYDIATKEMVARAPLASFRFIPRIGERIFIPGHSPGNWSAYSVRAVEYFLGYGARTGEPSQFFSHDMDRISVYVESSK